MYLQRPLFASRGFPACAQPTSSANSKQEADSTDARLLLLSHMVTGSDLTDNQVMLTSVQRQCSANCHCTKAGVGSTGVTDGLPLDEGRKGRD